MNLDRTERIRRYSTMGIVVNGTCLFVFSALGVRALLSGDNEGAASENAAREPLTVLIAEQMVDIFHIDPMVFEVLALVIVVGLCLAFLVSFVGSIYIRAAARRMDKQESIYRVARILSMVCPMMCVSWFSEGSFEIVAKDAKRNADTVCMMKPAVHEAMGGSPMRDSSKQSTEQDRA